MKTKKFNKLSLNKQTVASLNINRMNAIHGGATEEGCDQLTKMPICMLRKTQVCLVSIWTKTITITVNPPTTEPTTDTYAGGFEQGFIIRGR